LKPRAALPPFAARQASAGRRQLALEREESIEVAGKDVAELVLVLR
jgi:hypothetical protein